LLTAEIGDVTSDPVIFHVFLHNGTDGIKTSFQPLQSDSMKVLIENEAGSQTKHLYDEQTFVLKSTRIVQRAYPFPYGFIIGTQSGDGMCLDCFLLTRAVIRSGELLDAEPIGMFEQIEDDQEDHNILVTRPGELFELTVDVQNTLTDFVLNVFADVPGKSIRVGRFLGKEATLSLVASSARATG
jgi:inorganic pyrophosphatase